MHNEITYFDLSFRGFKSFRRVTNYTARIQYWTAVFLSLILSGSLSCGFPGKEGIKIKWTS